MSTDPEALKRLAALRAVEYVRSGMIVGLGTGSTTRYAIDALGERVKGGLDIVGVPTSVRSEEQAKALGIKLAELGDIKQIDITIDGADEIVLGALDAIKGRGGALLREKLVAVASREQIIIVDERKVVPRLGAHDPVPVEVIAFGWQHTAARLAALGTVPQLRKGDSDSPYLTDSGNYILDCFF